MATYILRDDELKPDFTEVNGFILDDDSLVFTGKFINVNTGEKKYNMTPMFLKSSGVSYLLKSVTFANKVTREDGKFDGEIVYTAIPLHRG